MLTFEALDNGVVEVHLNDKGISELESILSRLKGKKQDHDHLMTKDWGGNELSSENQNESAKLVNQVNIYVWNN